MLLAEEAAQSSSTFTGFDLFIILFTIIIIVGLYRLVVSKKKNYFAIGFCGVSLATFLFMDYIMISGW